MYISAATDARCVVIHGLAPLSPQGAGGDRVVFPARVAIGTSTGRHRVEGVTHGTAAAARSPPASFASLPPLCLPVHPPRAVLPPGGNGQRAAYLVSIGSGVASWGGCLSPPDPQPRPRPPLIVSFCPWGTGPMPLERLFSRRLFDLGEDVPWPEPSLSLISLRPREFVSVCLEMALLSLRRLRAVSAAEG